ncbi:ELM1/GtrOC1 family putative glycosyltransferase [Microbulbifer sp. VVAC002]|uniref:ELM1/GtrOC1 family putative glycosyltransferase n=1 Tax=Microbulbifer sp. VVAC002 TaxID=3243387 RepID=UPI00403A3063
MHILIIYDGKPGHLSPSLGLYQLLSRYSKGNYSYEITTSKPALKALNKPIRLLTRHLARNTHKFIMLFHRNPSFKRKPDLIISFGGNSVAANIALTKKTQCMNIAIGNIYSFRKTDFSLTLSTKEDIKKSRQYLPFSRIDVNLCKALGDNLKKKHHKPFYTLLIGGNGSGYKYTRKDYIDLIEELKKIAIYQNISWLISTSRRTPKYVAELIESNMPFDTCFNLLDYEAPNASLEEILGASEAVFITEDSSSMISEALALSKPIYTLVPQENKIYGAHKTLINKLYSETYIKRMEIFELAKTFNDSLSKDFNLDYGYHSKARYDEIISALNISSNGR